MVLSQSCLIIKEGVTPCSIPLSAWRDTFVQNEDFMRGGVEVKERGVWRVAGFDLAVCPEDW